MTSLLALCKFKFSDGTNPIAVKELKISYGSSGSYPQTGTVTLNVNSSAENVAVEAAASYSGPLTITLDKPTPDGVYVSLFPVTISLPYHFTVKDGSDNIYTGTANAQLRAGKYYDSTLKLTKNN